MTLQPTLPLESAPVGSSETDASPLRISYITAGGAGMFCGSCMRDNTLAAALTRLGCDVQLIPLYTPIRTDEENVSDKRVYFGGINVFLQEKVPLFRHVPAILDRWLDSPRLINWLASRRIKTSAAELGALTVSMLRGEAGHQRKEVERFVGWMAEQTRPDVVNFSDILIAGCLPALRREVEAPVLVTLQGDDLFLESLPEPYKRQALDEIRRLAEQIDGYIAFSRYYADFMADYLGLDRDKFHVVPLGVNTSDFLHIEPVPAKRPPTIGYLARVCPAKGLHVLVEAFLKLRQMHGMHDARIHVAGWLGADDAAYFDDLAKRLAALGLNDRFHYAGVVDRRGKLDFLAGIDVLSVPTTYREPKGIFVLEALAAGVPVVQPAHGAFPELLAATGGGVLVRPNDPDDLANALHKLLSVPEGRQALGREGRERVLRDFHAEEAARQTLAVYHRVRAAATNHHVNPTRSPA